jgi:hypothetical protein
MFLYRAASRTVMTMLVRQTLHQKCVWYLQSEYETESAEQVL